MKKKEKKSEKEGRSFFSLKKILILLILLSMTGAGGYIGFRHFTGDGYPGRKMVQVGLPENLLRFTYRQMPDVYNGLSSLNDEISVIKNEIKRIDGIEKKFPQQKKITEAEKKIWERSHKSLKSFLSKLEFQIESLYVAFKVNSVTGKELIENRREELDRSIREILDPSLKMTERLKRRKKEKGFINKIKGFLGKK